MARKGWTRHGGIRRIDVGIIRGFHPRQRIERQPITHGRIARDQITVLATQKPRFAVPASACGVSRHRQSITHDLLEASGEYPHQTLALEGIVNPGIKWIDVGGQAPLTPQKIKNVLVSREYMPRVEPQPFGDATEKSRSASLRRAIGSRFIRNERLMAPDRLTVGAPETVERPAWELFARIPFALAEMDQALHPVALAQTMIEIGGEPALVRSQRRGVPFFAVGIIDRYKRRLSTHRQSHIASREIGIHMVAELIDGPPFFIGI